MYIASLPIASLTHSSLFSFPTTPLKILLRLSLFPISTDIFWTCLILTFATIECHSCHLLSFMILWTSFASTSPASLAGFSSFALPSNVRSNKNSFLGCCSVSDLLQTRGFKYRVCRQSQIFFSQCILLSWTLFYKYICTTNKCQCGRCCARC